MNSQASFYYANYNNSETYLKLFSLCNDIKKSWYHDCDETESMKEIIEIIDGMLIMTSLEDYFLENKRDLDYFMGDFTKDVITNIMIQPVIFGDNGDEIAFDLIYHFIQLFMHYHKNKEYAPLFEKIRKIFSKEYSNAFFNPNSKSCKKENNPKKVYTYEQFNEEFCKDFKIEENNHIEQFRIGDKVDVLIKNKISTFSLSNYNWVRGIINDIKDNEYIIEYPYKNTVNNKVTYPIDSPNILKEGIKTVDWDWRLSLKENDIIDCYTRSKWYPATIVKVKEYINKNGLILREYKIGFRLYPDHFLENNEYNNEYDYNTLLKCTAFWDSKNEVDSEGNTFYGDREAYDENIPFYSKRIQKFGTFSKIQREIIINKSNNLINNYNSMSTKKLDIEEKLKIMTEFLENDKNEKEIDELYLYEKDGQKNYIIGKGKDNFSYYFAKLLKIMADNGNFEEMINILKDKPTPDEIYNIFFILMHCISFIHKGYFNENYNIFKNAYFDMMDSLSSKDMRSSFQKEVVDLANNFFIKINYLISKNKNIQNLDMNDINLTLALKMLKSSIFDKKIQGLKSIGELINNISGEEGKKDIINFIKKNEIIKELFGSNYHTQIISKSNNILEFMLKNNEISEEEIKLIWSLTEQGDLEAKTIIIKLLLNLVDYLNEKYCNILIGCINSGKNIKLNENEIELIYNLAIKGNNEDFMLKCCEYYCKNILEINDLNKLSKSSYVDKLVNLFSKNKKCCQMIIDICENSLKKNKNVLPIFFLLDKIIEHNKNHIYINSDNNNENNDNDFINKSIHNLIDNDKLLNLFKDNTLLYKKQAKEIVKENKNEKNLIVEGYTHEDNMKNRILFLIKIIPILYPKFDFFKLLKEICLQDPVFQSDKLLFYDFMKKFISEINSKPDFQSSNQQKIEIETQLFNMLTEENKTEMSSSQYNLYIEIFLDINKEKELLHFYKNQNDEYIININNNVNIDDIFGMDKLWNLLFQLKNDELIEKLINFIYYLYKDKEEIQKLLDKCVNLIKDIENITYDKLEKCINILKYIIIESEKEEYCQIKSHNDLLKDCLINIPLDQKKVKKASNIISLQFNSNKANYDEKDLLFGNTYFNELKQIISEKYNLKENNINITYSFKEKNSLKTILLDSSYNNKSLKEILKLDNNIEKKNIKLNSSKFSFTGENKEKESFFKITKINQKFENMLKEWFDFFSDGNQIMDKDSIINFISYITSNQNVDENNIDYIQFMDEVDKAKKNFILEEEFIEYYSDMARTEPEKMKKIIKLMKYGEDFQKIKEYTPIKTFDKQKLPRYILGNDKQFHDTLIQLFTKFSKNSIYEFLFFLCTNENEYNELLDNYKTLFNKENNNNNNNNCLQILYKLVIIESILQDLEVNQIDINKLFVEKKNNSKKENNFKISSKKYIPFDNENNLNKKLSFIINFIENDGYDELINYTANLLDCFDKNNSNDDEQIKFNCCQKCLKFINIIYNSFLKKKIIINNNEKFDVYYLGNNININIIIIQNNNENNKEKNNESNYNKLKEKIFKISYLNLIKKIIKFLLNSKNNNLDNQVILNYCFNLLISLITSNELLFSEIKKDYSIKEDFSNLIKNNINCPNNNENFFLKLLNKFINNLSSSKKDINKLEGEFLYFLFEISNSLFRDLLNKSNENKNDINDKNDKNEINSDSYSLLFEFFCNLFELILNSNLSDNINNNLINEFISQLYELLYNDLKEKNKEIKLPEETFYGFMNILITTIKSNQLLKSQIISKKIKDETLFELIYDLILSEKKNDNNINEIIKEESEIDNLISNIKDYPTDSKFLKMENLDELINDINLVIKNKNKEEISQKIYDILYNFILECLNNSIEPLFISKLLNLISINNESKYFQKNDSHKPKIPKSFDHVGLKNIGCVCYMNSILQQMYMVPSFRYAIMSADDKKGKNYQISFFYNNTFDDNLLHQLQKMYTFLTYSEKQAYNPKDFCSSFKDFDGAPINPLLQQDSQEFYNNFCDKIENSLKNTKYKYIIENIFTGKTCSSVICEKCKTVSNRFEDFYNLSLEVKNIGSLYESLEKLIEPEKIEQFNCEVCKEKVTISKRTSLSKLPNVLFIHLKRFYMNYEIETTEKINSKFEFPNTLDLKKYCIEEIIKNNKETYETDDIYPKNDEYYQYELKGINVHMGNAQGGHYISFIDIERDGHDNEQNIKESIENNIIKSNWLKFNDSIITKFDTKDIPIESYGGYVDNDINNENIQSAYLLIYERKKKTPIKIILDIDKVNYFQNKEKYLYNNNIIAFGKEQKSSINKYYDISYSKRDGKINQEELYNLIFCEEETKECYSYIPYYNIEKTVLKEIFIEVMNKNKQFFNNVKKPNENIKYKDKCNDILINNIGLKDFNILNSELPLNEKKLLISFFKEEIFKNEIFKNNNIKTDEEQKIIINDHANILLEKLILPIISTENKNKEIDDLIEAISDILISNSNLEKIFETRSVCRIFDNKNIKIMSDSIYTIIAYFNSNQDIKPYFNKIYKFIDKINEEEEAIIIVNNSKNKGDISPLFYLYELIFKILKINNNLIELLISQKQINTLLGKIDNINSIDIRNCIYNILIYLIDHCYNYNGIKMGNNNINKIEKDAIKNKIYKREILIQKLFSEKAILLGKLIRLTQYNDSNLSDKFNKKIISSLYNYAIRANKLTQLFDLLYEIISINDEYILNRLYLIMGYPEIIIKHQIKDQDEDDENEENENKLGKEDKENIKDKDKNKVENKSFWPLFGCTLFEKSNNGEIFKYVNTIKIYETHCIYSQLFPCTNDEFYDNPDIYRNEPKLTEKERNNYIYKLLSISLLNEGNYPLFKYIYLTQSRFAIKYRNLYEEIIEILSKENKYDLTEIKKNAEICIKRINFEINKIKETISLISNKNFDENEDSKKENDKNLENVEKNNEIPQLPEKMMKHYKGNSGIEEFTGFIPEHLPDQIKKVEYSSYAKGDKTIFLCVKYYTTMKKVESLREKKRDKENKNNINNDDNNGDNNNNDDEQSKIIKDKEKEKENKNDLNNELDDADFEENEEIKLIDINDISESEKIFLNKYYKSLRQKNKIIIEDKSLKNNKNAKLSLIRYLLFSYIQGSRILNAKIKEEINKYEIKFNYYTPDFSIYYINPNNCIDVIRVYRRHKLLEFINKYNLRISLYINHTIDFDDDDLNEGNIDFD